MKKVLLCYPQNFEVVYKINPWMNPDKNKVVKNKAIYEWENLVKVYKELNVEVKTVNSVNGLPDMVFAANGFFCINKTAIVARFRYPERQGETKYYAQWLQDEGFKVIDPGSIVYEGEGDTFLIENYIFQGWGFRSDYDITLLLKKYFSNKKIIALHLIDDRFYHLDTCFFPINKNLVYYFDKAFDNDSIKIIKNFFKNAVAVDREEALSFSLNSVVIDNKIIMNSESDKFAQRVKNDGFAPVKVEMREYMKSGGSVKCLTNEIW